MRNSNWLAQPHATKARDGSFRRAVGDCLPPFLKRLISPYGCRGKFSSFDQARTKCADSSYTSPFIAKAVATKTRTYRDSLLQGAVPTLSTQNVVLLFAIQPLLTLERPIVVLDFGGACGTHYFVAKSFFGKIAWDWRVVETSVMLSVASDFSSPELAFYSGIGEARQAGPPPDLVLSSSTLQYLPDPLSSLHDLVGIGATRMLLMRNGLLESGRTIVSVQRSPLQANGPGQDEIPNGRTIVHYPVTFIERDAFEATLAQRYTIVARVQEDANYFVGLRRISSFGYVALRQV